MNYPISSLGDSIYNTNIPGIGLRLYREAADSSNFSGYYPYKRNITSTGDWSLASGYFVVEVIKTADITGSGALATGRYSTYYVTGQQNNPFLTTTISSTAPILIASSSCEVQGGIDKVIQLPAVTKSAFRAIGTTQGEQNFSLSILCSGSENLSGTATSNTISLSFDYLQDSTNNQVIQNTATNTNKASGIGVQLLSTMNNMDTPISTGSALTIGKVSSNQTMQYDVPLKARYYQTSDTVTAGEVKTTATITIQYN